MSSIAVITDSACDLSAELTEQASITVVPLTIRFGDEEFHDRRDLSPTEFWERCRNSPALPETAAPSPGDFKKSFDEARSNGADGVICLTLSSKVSATYQAALAGKEAAGDGAPIEVVDTLSLTMGQGLLCLEAARLAGEGGSLDEIATQIHSMLGRTHVYGVVGALDHLQRGGRIGGAQALLGSLLSIKPVIMVEDGKVEPESRQRTRSKALDYLVAKVKGAGALDRLAVCDGSSSDIGDVVKRLSEIPVANPLEVVELGPVVGTHAGPETIGVAYIASGD